MVQLVVSGLYKQTELRTSICSLTAALAFASSSLSSTGRDFKQAD